MTTHDQVLNELRRLIATAECGDCETPTNTRLTCQRAVELIEALTTRLQDIESRRTDWALVNPRTGEVTQGLIVGRQLPFP